MAQQPPRVPGYAAYPLPADAVVVREGTRYTYTWEVDETD